MTRVSTRRSAAVAQAEPIAIPRSTELIAHGTKSGFSTQVSKPQWAQFKPCTFWEVPIITTASALFIFSASRSKLESGLGRYPDHLIGQAQNIPSVTIAISMISIPLPLGAVRAAVIIRRAACNTSSCLISLSFCINILLNSVKQN